MKGFIIEVLEIKVSERIDKKNIKSFLQTNIDSESIPLTNNSQIYYNFIKQFSIYQILIFDKDSPPSVFFIDTVENELVISNNYFAIFKNKKLFYYHKLEEKINIDELKLYIKSTLEIVISKVTYFEKEFQNLNSEFLRNYSFIKLKKQNLFRVYMFYLIFLLSFSLFYFITLDMQEDKIDELSVLNKKMQEIKNRNEFFPVSPLLMKVFKDVKTNGLVLENFQLKNNVVNLKIKCVDKNRVFKMLEQYRNINISSISFDEKGNEYIIDANFRIFRK